MMKKQLSGNGEPLWNTYIHAKGKALGIPVAGNFELTTRCNLNCKMCYVHNCGLTEELSAKEWIEIGNAAVKSGMIFLLLTGGEPLVRKDFKEIYLALKKMGLLISINTNATLIDDEMFEFLIENPPLRMNISLYGTSNETYLRLCGRPVYDIVVKNITRLHEAGISIRLNASITPYNACDIEELYQFADKLNIPIKATTYMFPDVRVNGCKYGEAMHRFKPEDAAKYMVLCKEQYLNEEQLSEFAKIGHFEDEDCYSEGEGMRCRAGSTSFWMTWDGRMLPCGMFATEGYSVKAYGFKEAWNAVRNETKSILLPAECRGCALKGMCPSCAAACMAETGKTDIKPEYICKMTKGVQELAEQKYRSRNN